MPSEMGAASSPVVRTARLQARDFAPLLFGLRTAVAALAALWIAMWLQLDNPRWAAWTVMALALPTRGQIAGKGLWRAIGTLLGLGAGLVGMALFSQSPVGMGLYMTALMVVASLVGGRLPALAAYGTALAGLTACLIAVESADTPLSSFALALERSSAIVVGIGSAYCVSALAEILHGSPRVTSPTLPRLPPATIVANAQRAGLAFVSAWGIWLATAWPSGPIFMVLVAALLLNFTTIPNVNRLGGFCLWGVGLGQGIGLWLKYAVLTSQPSFGVLAAALFPFLFLGAVGMTDRRSMIPFMGFNIAFLLAIEPRNPMQYDLGASLNEVVGIFLGVALVIAAYRFIRPQQVWSLP